MSLTRHGKCRGDQRNSTAEYRVDTSHIILRVPVNFLLIVTVSNDIINKGHNDKGFT